jgi:hypothetical protein
MQVARSYCRPASNTAVPNVSICWNSACRPQAACVQQVVAEGRQGDAGGCGAALGGWDITPQRCQRCQVLLLAGCGTKPSSGSAPECFAISSP